MSGGQRRRKCFLLALRMKEGAVSSGMEAGSFKGRETIVLWDNCWDNTTLGKNVILLTSLPFSSYNCKCHYVVLYYFPPFVDKET